MGMFNQVMQDIIYCIQTKNYNVALVLIDCLLVVERTKYGNV
jgi:hypothetical protein